MADYEMMLEPIEEPIQGYGMEQETQQIQGLRTLPVSKANETARQYLEDLDTGDEIALDQINALVERLLRQGKQVGDADDFHNLAVNLARSDLYDLACQILQRGLESFPKNVDLLADFLQYGVNCGLQEECKKYYKVLTKIPKLRWTWRGYSFSIHYLNYLVEQTDSEKELLRLQKEMMDIVAAFRKNLPYSEESYRSEAQVYETFHLYEKELEVLQRALKELKICPKCALRLADLLFDRGCFDEALQAIQRGIGDATQTQSTVSEGYLYYLSGLTKVGIAQRDGVPADEKTVLDIYSDFNISLMQIHNNSYEKVMKSKVIMLVNKTGVLVPQEYEELAVLVG